MEKVNKEKNESKSLKLTFQLLNIVHEYILIFWIHIRKKVFLVKERNNFDKEMFSI